MSQSNIAKLQAVQNFACRIVSGAQKYDHVTHILRQLNWLQVKQHLYYCDSIMAFKLSISLPLSTCLIKHIGETARETDKETSPGTIPHGTPASKPT